MRPCPKEDAERLAVGRDRITCHAVGDAGSRTASAAGSTTRARTDLPAAGWAEQDANAVLESVQAFDIPGADLGMGVEECVRLYRNRPLRTDAHIVTRDPATIRVAGPALLHQVLATRLTRTPR